MQRSSVDLPEPEAPMMEMTSPFLTVKVDIAQDLVRAEGLAQVPDLKNVVCHLSGPLSPFPSCPRYSLLLLVIVAAALGVRIGPGGHGERILLHELVAVGAIHTLFDQTEDAGGDQGHERGSRPSR